MTVKDRIGNKYIRYGILSFLIFSLLISVTITVSAKQTDHNNNGNKACSDCHSDVHKKDKKVKDIGTNNQKGQQQNINQKGQQQNINQKGQPGATIGQSAMSTRVATNTVIGDITLITSLGQDWYQQGIYGPSSSTTLDQSWGWTFWDENPPSTFMIPPEKVTQRNNIYALLLDSGNNSNPITGAQVTANVTYWKYNGANYVSQIVTVPLYEDINNKGFYNGTFYFYGGTSYTEGSGGMTGWYCDGCHPGYGAGTIDTQAGYFPGNYTVSIKAEADSKISTTETNFDVTAWGCEDCHGSGNQHSAGVDMDSACYICHGVDEITHYGTDPGNPHQNTAHRNINCVDCHTSKSLNPQTFNGVTFVGGGLNGNIPQYGYNVVQLNKGKHSNLVCQDCHNNLVLPTPQGSYNANGYIVTDKVNNRDATFAGIQQFQNYYVINVDQSGPLNITLNWEGTSNLGFYLYPPNFNPRNRTVLGGDPNKGAMPYIDGATSSGKPERFVNNTPLAGQWILEVYGYNLIDTGWTWYGVLQSPINYTVSSTYPIQMKDLPSTPECNSCHNSNGQGGASTTLEIPNWNPGYAHADTNGDGSLDVQCRMCHNSMHNIDIKNCRDCHNNVPTGHIIVEPQYSQYTTSQCLLCHGDPHKVSAQAEACIECHGIGYEGANPVATTTLVNISLFNISIHQNINDRVNKDYRVTNDDCWQCHYNKDMDRQNVRKCGYCHSKTSQWHGDANVTTNLTELAIR